MKNIIVIGGGASGMMAAIAASANGAKVTIIEQNAFPGKKILSTGNGRCNYTNFVQTPSCYRSDDPQFPWQVIRQFDEQKTVGFLRSWHLPKGEERLSLSQFRSGTGCGRCFGHGM